MRERRHAATLRRQSAALRRRRALRCAAIARFRCAALRHSQAARRPRRVGVGRQRAIARAAHAQRRAAVVKHNLALLLVLNAVLALWLCGRRVRRHLGHAVVVARAAEAHIHRETRAHRDSSLRTLAAALAAHLVAQRRLLGRAARLLRLAARRVPHRVRSASSALFALKRAIARRALAATLVCRRLAAAAAAVRRQVRHCARAALRGGQSMLLFLLSCSQSPSLSPSR